jgi:hypothetical protein
MASGIYMLLQSALQLTPALPRSTAIVRQMVAVRRFIELLPFTVSIRQPRQVIRQRAVEPRRMFDIYHVAYIVQFHEARA